MFCALLSVRVLIDVISLPDSLRCMSVNYTEDIISHTENDDKFAVYTTREHFIS